MTTPAPELGIDGAADMSHAEASARARRAYIDDPTLTGADLARMFARSPRWGQKQRNAVDKGDSHVVQLRRPAGGGTAPVRRDTAPPQQQATTAARRQTVRAPGVTPLVLWITGAAAAVVAIVGAAMSFTHMTHLAAATGQGRASWLLPISVDGLMLVASMVMLVQRRTGEPVGRLAWAALAAGVAASVGANLAAAELDTVNVWVARAVSAWPPVALLIAGELLLQMIRTDRKKGARR